MESKSKIDISQILEKIKRHFDFLFRRGFRITSALFVGARDGQWQIMLREGNYLIQLQGYEEMFGLALSRVKLCDEVGFFELHDLIHLMEMERNGLPVLGAPPLDVLYDVTGIAELLEKHLDDTLVLIDRIHHWNSNSEARALFRSIARAF